MKKFRLFITETGRENLKVKAEAYNFINEYFDTKEALKEFLIDRYGKMPKGKNKIYTGPNNNQKVMGFTHSFWNQDISHNSHKCYQTDWIKFWIEVAEATTKIPFTL